MKNSEILVISPKCSKESAQHLASLILADYMPHATTFDYTNYRAVINYGSSQPAQFRYVVNKPEAVKLCVNKISTLKRVEHGVAWTKDKDIAKTWLGKDEYVVARALETGSHSEGVTIVSNSTEFKETPAKFWTRWFDHDYEVRVNVFKGQILSVFNKEVKGEFFNFVPLEIQGTKNPEVQAMIKSIEKNIGIDFYGIDILVNSKGHCKLLEVNSGPTLHPETEPAFLQALYEDLLKNA